MKILIIGKVWPEPASSAAGLRMLQLIDLFQRSGYAVHFCSAANHTDHETNLKELNVIVREVKMNDTSFDDYVSLLQPDVVLFDRFMTEEQFGWRVADHAPNALRILDTEDLHLLRGARQDAVKQKRNLHESDLFNETAIREIASILRCDLSLIISDSELELLKHIFKVDPALLHYIPFLVNAEDIHPDEWNGFEDREHFVTIGNFLHEPNRDAVLFLKEKVWPEIHKELPEAQLHVYGAYLPQSVQELHNEKEGFLIKGRAEDALKVIRNARLLLAPLRFGAGLKGKLLDAMLTGTPSVTSPLGAEGMKGDFEWPGAVREDGAAFAEAAVHGYRHQGDWEEARNNILPLLKSRFDKCSHEQSFMNRVGELLDTLEDHRAQNFLGSMLMHHSLASTRYMGKWIEEKNKA